MPNLGGTDAPLTGTPPSGVDYRPENPFVPPKGTGVVTAGPLKPLGVDVEDIAKVASTGGLASRINANIQIARNPELQRAIQPIARRLQAPSAGETAVNIGLGNLIAPISDAAANKATEHDIDAYAAGGGDPGKHANLFGAASALGAVAGNTAIAGTGRGVASVGSRAIEEAPAARTALGRIGQSALSGGVTNAGIGAGGEALFGDEHGQRNLGDVVKTGLEQGAVGAAAGGLLGGVSEGIGALARKFRPENPFVHPTIEAAHDVAKEESPDAIKNNLPTTFRPENPFVGDAPVSKEVPVSASAPQPLRTLTGPVADNASPRAGLTYRDVVNMDAPSLRAAHAEQSAYESGGEEAIFGAEGAKQYKRLYAAANNTMDPQRADAASAQLSAMEDALTEPQRNRLYGIGETGYNADDLDAIARDAHFYSPSQAHDIPQQMLLSTVGRELTTGKPLTDAGSAVRLKGAMAELNRRGMQSDEVLRQALAGRVMDGYATPGQVNELAKSTLSKLAQARQATAQPARLAVRAGAIDPALLARGGGAAIGGVAGAGYGATQGDTPEDKAKNALIYGGLGAAAGYGAGRLATDPALRQSLSESYRSAMVTPYAKIERDYPELASALNTAGASTQAAQHIANRRVGWVTEGLQPEQKQTFTNILLRDTNLAKADAATARGETAAAQRFTDQANSLDQSIPQGSENEQWFKDALDRHNQYIGTPLANAAQRAGVSSMLPVQSAYLRGVSKDRLDNEELRRAMDARAITDPSKIQSRGPIGQAILGERPEVARLQRATGGIPQGPINPNIPTVPEGSPRFNRGASRTGSANAAQGTAREYVNDYQTLVQRDAEDKIVRGATNDVYGALDNAGFKRLAPKEDPPIGMQALQRSVPDPSGSGNTVTERWAVPRNVKNAVDHFEQKRLVTDQSGKWRQFTSAMTQAQISGMPVEATSHMNTLASIVASVPGEKDLAGKAMAAVPGIGAKAAAIREIAGIDFTKPETRALESRLADIGALRVQDNHGGLIHKSSNALFGPTGVDVRGRLVLARKYLDRKPDASDAELREFITSKLGNYTRANSGTLVNGLQDAGVSSFARFQAARIPGSIRSTFGFSGLPANGAKQRIGDIANTLYRGPVGYAAAGQAANYAMTGHGMQDNERGHQLDVELPFKIGANDDPTYIPLAFSNPVLATGLRSTGARDLAPLPGSPNVGGKVADAARDVVNTGLGVLSPAVRAASIGASGRTPYMLSDGSMLRVNNNKFDKGSQAASNIRSAISLANPAASAFAEQGGDLGGHRLSDELAQDGRSFGGPKAIAARAAEFIAPRVLSIGVGGRDNALSAESRDQREYNDAMKDYKAQLRRAPGPITEQHIINQAIADAKKDGRFDPDMVGDELDKYLDGLDGPKKAVSRDRSLEHWSDKHKLNP